MNGGYKYIQKSEGLSTDPRGTPYFIGEGEELYMCTLLLRSGRYEVNYKRAISLTPSKCINGRSDDINYVQ